LLALKEIQKALGIVLPEKGGLLVTVDGSINLYMESTHSRVPQKINAIPSVHTYLDGIATLQDKTEIAEKLKDNDLLTQITFDICKVIQDPAFFR